MNLCGGIANLTEQEIFLSIPDDEFRMTTRREKSSSTPSRRNKSTPDQLDATPSSTSRRTPVSSGGNNQTRSSSSSHNRSISSGATASSTSSETKTTAILNPVSREDLKLLNPVSRDDLKRYRSRQRGHPLRGLKSTSILMKKLESGFNLTWLNEDTKGQTVNLATSSDKSHLRIRLRNRGGDDNENDGSKSNLPSDIKLKVRHIARVGSDNEESGSEHEGSKETAEHKSTSYFTIKLKTIVGDWSKFKFVAESLAERDTVVLAIRSLMDQAKVPHGVRKTHHVESVARSKGKVIGESVEASETSVQPPKDPSEEGFASETAFFGFDMENVKPARRNDFAKSKPEGRDGSERRSSHRRKADHHDSDGPDGRDFIESIGKRAVPVGSDVDGRAINEITKGILVEKKSSTTSNSSTEKEIRNGVEILTLTQSEISNSHFAEQQLTVRKTRKESSSSNFVNSKPSGNDKNRNGYSRRKTDSKSKEVGFDRKIGLDRMNVSVIYETIGCSALGCQSQALSAVEDGDLATMAANQMSGPWCTDDICTASLKDFADSMKGIFDVKEGSSEGVYAVSSKQRAMAEEYISGFIGDNTTIGEFLSVNDLWNIAATKIATGEKLRRVQNRSRSVDGKAIRLKSLKMQMTFVGADTKSKSFVQTANSFDDLNRSGKWERKKESSTLKIAGQFDSSAYLDRDVNEVQDIDGCELLYYDSDPEGARERTLKRGPRRAMAEVETAVDDKIESRSRQALDILDSSRLGLGRKWKRLEEDLVMEIIEATKNEKLVMMWHPTQNGVSGNLPPICVKLWVESGVYLMDGTFLLPKLTWLPVHESKLDARVLNVSDENPGSLDLLDVCRVKECDSIDRNLHPFARVDRSFVIQTQNSRYLFETQSEHERGRIVNGLKLVIARLASLLMLRDLRAVDEFFGGNSVPGEAPAWAQTEKSESTSDDFPST